MIFLRQNGAETIRSLTPTCESCLPTSVHRTTHRRLIALHQLKGGVVCVKCHGRLVNAFSTQILTNTRLVAVSTVNSFYSYKALLTGNLSRQSDQNNHWAVWKLLKHQMVCSYNIVLRWKSQISNRWTSCCQTKLNNYHVIFWQSRLTNHHFRGDLKHSQSL